MPSPPDNVHKALYFSLLGCPVVPFVCSFVYSSGPVVTMISHQRLEQFW